MTLKMKAKSVGLWVLQILLALVFLQASLVKLTGHPGMAERFRGWGYPDEFRLLIGTLEILGAIGLLVPALAGYAATGLMGIMVGAIATHIVHREAQVVVAAVVLLLLSVVILARRPSFGFLQKK